MAGQGGTRARRIEFGLPGRENPCYEWAVPGSRKKRIEWTVGLVCALVIAYVAGYLLVSRVYSPVAHSAAGETYIYLGFTDEMLLSGEGPSPQDFEASMRRARLFAHVFRPVIWLDQRLFDTRTVDHRAFAPMGSPP